MVIKHKGKIISVGDVSNLTDEQIQEIEEFEGVYVKLDTLEEAIRLIEWLGANDG